MTAWRTAKHARPIPAQTAKEVLTKAMTVHFQIRTSKKSSLNHTRRSGRDAQDAAKCAKESADVQGWNVYVDTTFATIAQGPYTLAMVVPSVNTVPD